MVWRWAVLRETPRFLETLGWSQRRHCVKTQALSNQIGLQTWWLPMWPRDNGTICPFFCPSLQSFMAQFEANPLWWGQHWSCRRFPFLEVFRVLWGLGTSKSPSVVETHKLVWLWPSEGSVPWWESLKDWHLHGRKDFGISPFVASGVSLSLSLSCRKPRYG